MPSPGPCSPHAQGRIHDRSHEAQQKRVMALNLVDRRHRLLEHGATVEKAATHLRRERRLPDRDACFGHVSPFGMGAHRVDR